MADTVTQMSDKRAEQVDLADLTKMLDDAIDETRPARRDSEKVRDYYDGNQLTAREKQTLAKRHQPEVINNKVATTVDFLKGFELRSRSDPRAFPRTPDHEEDGWAATDALRYVADNTDFQSIASEVFENLVIEGPAGVSVDVEKRRGKIEIVVNHVPFDRMIFDQYSRKKQKTDIRFSGVVLWMDLDAAKEKWPDKAEKLENDFQNHSSNGLNVLAGRDEETYGDKPRWYRADGRRRIMVVEMYFLRKGKWHRAVFSHDTYLEEPKVSPYKDEDGLPENPHIFACPKISREGHHYGPILPKLSMQDDINKRRSKATDMLTRRQTFSKQGMLDDIDKFKREANDSGGHLEFPAGPGEFGKDFGFIENINLGQAQFEMYKDALSDMEALSNASIAAKNETNMSGRALRELSGARSTEIQPTIEVYTQWRIRVFRAIWNRIRQYWKEERWIRVTDDDSTSRFVGVNRTKTVEDAVIEKFGFVPDEIQGNPKLKQPVAGPDGKPVPHNRIADLDVDITIEEVPDVVNLQAEQFEILAELYKVNPEGIPWETLIRMSQLRDKDQILGGRQSPEAKRQQAIREQQQRAAMQLDQQEQLSRTKRNEAQAAETMTRAQQTQLENEILSQFPVAPTSLSL